MGSPFWEKFVKNGGSEHPQICSRHSSLGSTILGPKIDDFGSQDRWFSWYFWTYFCHVLCLILFPVTKQCLKIPSQSSQTNTTSEIHKFKKTTRRLNVPKLWPGKGVKIPSQSSQTNTTSQINKLTKIVAISKFRKRDQKKVSKFHLKVPKQTQHLRSTCWEKILAVSK